MTGIRHVLLDADGVLQHLPGGWYTALEPYLGDRTREFLHTTWRDELPALAGRGDYFPLFAALLAQYDVATPAEDVYRAVWHNIAVIERTFEIVDALKAAGYGVHLATNQERRRAAHMRVALGYDDVFDVSCYSYDLGVAKPDPAFFVEAARRIGAEPDSILFIDDNVRNVEGARAARLAAEQWDHEQGHSILLDALAQHGITLPSTLRVDDEFTHRPAGEASVSTILDELRADRL